MTSVDEYVASVPQAARARFDDLRALVKELLPDAEECVSYKILGYRTVPKKGPRVFIAGWEAHLGLYPVPSDPELEALVEPYRHGKGTLRFSVDQPLPRELITRVVRALTGVVENG